MGCFFIFVIYLSSSGRDGMWLGRGVLVVDVRYSFFFYIFWGFCLYVIFVIFKWGFWRVRVFGVIGVV